MVQANLRCLVDSFWPPFLRTVDDGWFFRIHDDQTKRTSSCSLSCTWIFWNDTLVCTWNVLYYNFPSLPNTLWASVMFCFWGSKWYASSQGVWQSLGNFMRSFSRDTCCTYDTSKLTYIWFQQYESLIWWLLSQAILGGICRVTFLRQVSNQCSGSFFVMAAAIFSTMLLLGEQILRDPSSMQVLWEMIKQIGCLGGCSRFYIDVIIRVIYDIYQML